MFEWSPLISGLGIILVSAALFLLSLHWFDSGCSSSCSFGKSIFSESCVRFKLCDGDSGLGAMLDGDCLPGPDFDNNFGGVTMCNPKVADEA